MIKKLKILILGLLFSTLSQAQCYPPIDTIFSNNCNYVIESPAIPANIPFTGCFLLYPEGSLIEPGFISIQSSGCGPFAYTNLSYSLYTSHCDSLTSGEIFPVSINPVAEIPDTTEYYILCFTWLPLCDQDAYCATYDYSFMPVEMLYFRGKENGETIKLEWATGSEHGSSHFLVTRSEDLFTWKAIDLIGSTGWSYSKTTYESVDAKPINGVSYYRLAQVDMDGSFTFSTIVAVSRFGYAVDQKYNVIGQEVK
jgi:hypothetical protein